MPPQPRAEVRAKGRAKGRWRAAGRGRGARAGNAARVCNARKARRKTAAHQLNVLAAEVGLPPTSVKRLRAAGVEQLARALQRRMRSAADAARLRVPVEAWVANGGGLSVPVLDEDDPNSQPKSPLDGHRVLAGGISLEVKGLHADVQQCQPHA